MSLQELVTSLAQSQTQFRQETKNTFSNIQAQIGDLATALNKMEQRGKLPSQTKKNLNVSEITLRSGKTLGEINPKRVSREEEDEVIIVEPPKVVATPKDPIVPNIDQPESSNKNIKPLVIPPPFPSRLASSKKQEEEKEFLETFRKPIIPIPEPPHPITRSNFIHTRTRSTILPVPDPFTTHPYNPFHLSDPPSNPCASRQQPPLFIPKNLRSHQRPTSIPPLPTSHRRRLPLPPPPVRATRHDLAAACRRSPKPFFPADSHHLFTPPPSSPEKLKSPPQPPSLADLTRRNPSSAAGHRPSPPPAAATTFHQNFQIFVSHRRLTRFNLAVPIQAWGAVLAVFFSGFDTRICISAFTTSDPETWFLPEELHDDDAVDDDDMQVDTGYAGSPFEAEDHYDLPIRQLPPPYYAQPSGAHYGPHHEYQSYQQRNEPEPEYHLDIYAQLAALRLQGNRNTTAIRHIEEQQARTNNYMEDLWHHFQPEGGYRPRGPPTP
ncbi:unnamed protein product [Lactuca virosa]|uniref:Uncharacterized protein n=1 Tax=Lactuca virosa TaxID=75947 RepID=A0AAU9NYB4_9ASTR|nr:unnamed protein product [Lactuca virosa]